LEFPPGELGIPSRYGEYESRYIATFDVGQPHPPVPLIESHYNKREPVPRILHENMMFYQRFGLRLSPNFAETSDHLLCQLSFAVQLLAMIRDRLHADNHAEATQITQALKDYTRRHLKSWIPLARGVAEGAPLATAASILSIVDRLTDLCNS
jgi:TorA maturation chaperone TorD